MDYFTQIGGINELFKRIKSNFRFLSRPAAKFARSGDRRYLVVGLPEVGSDTRLHSMAVSADRKKLRQYERSYFERSDDSSF